MCGICFFLSHPKLNGDDYKSTSEFIKRNSRLVCRGPDNSHQTELQLSHGQTATLLGHVLHFRGSQLVPQPATDLKGNQLLWNGEIYSGIDVTLNQSDTTVLLEQLGNEDSDQNIVATMSRIQGPWSFIYWQAKTECLWFGRDMFGRRSLLWYLPETESDPFILSSVQIMPWTFLEVPAVGIYKVCLKESLLHLSVIPWRKAVWPGSLELVQNNGNFSQKLYPGHVSENVVLTLTEEMCLVPSFPEICTHHPPPDYRMPDLGEDQSAAKYLDNLCQTDSYLRKLSRQLTDVLMEAVRVRVFNQCKLDTLRESQNSVLGQKDFSDETDRNGLPSATRINDEMVNTCCVYDEDHSIQTSPATLAILFSGGIDSTVLAALADRCLPPDEEIDLLNVAFEMKQKENPTNKKNRTKELPADKKWYVPDRQTGYIALSELNPNRKWNFIEVNVTAEELQQARQSYIAYLLHPLHTVLDDSIGCAVWFASRGQGILGNGPFKGCRVVSKAQVILCGMGADEQLVGYSRHRVRFKEEGWEGLINEIQLEITRLSARNLGRDDRIITDHGKESRLPFLDENVVQFLCDLPLYQKADLSLPRGLGEKLLLRLSAYELGLRLTSSQPKRAIQFGSRIAKMENSKEKASDTCDRLSSLT